MFECCFMNQAKGNLYAFKKYEGAVWIYHYCYPLVGCINGICTVCSGAMDGDLGYYDGWYHQAPEIHKSVGCILFAVMLFRVIWRFISPPPKPLSSYNRLTRVSAVLAHLMLYSILFCLMLSGYLISTADGQPINVFGWFAIPVTLAGLPDQADTAGTIHLYLAWAVVVLSLLHGLAALKHHFIDGDITLKRMLGRSID